MDTLCLCIRGMAGVGKRVYMHDKLKQIAAYRGVPFNIQTKTLSFDAGNASTVAQGGDEEDKNDSHTIDYESSLVHIGFDIARMSMQDKNILRPVLTNYGKGSHVLSGEYGRGNRIVVLYHSHLLSSESIMILQSVLEQNDGCLSLWLTSELPVSLRIRDWFIEIPVEGEDKNYQIFQSKHKNTIHNWSDVFREKLICWKKDPNPNLSEVYEIKKFVYEILMRNLRWVECVHFLLDVIIQEKSFTEFERRKLLEVLASTEATGGGITLPSYRIPIVWENLFVKLRNCLVG